MKNKNAILGLLISVFVSCLMISCDRDDELSDNSQNSQTSERINIEYKDKEVTNLSGELEITINSSSDYTINCKDSWLHVKNKSQNKATIAYDKNDDIASRKGTIKFTCGDKSETLSISQMGKALITYDGTYSYEYDENGKIISFTEIDANETFIASNGGKKFTCTISDEDGDKENVVYTITTNSKGLATKVVATWTLDESEEDYIYKETETHTITISYDQDLLFKVSDSWKWTCNDDGDKDSDNGKELYEYEYGEYGLSSVKYTSDAKLLNVDKYAYGNTDYTNSQNIYTPYYAEIYPSGLELDVYLDALAVMGYFGNTHGKSKDTCLFPSKITSESVSGNSRKTTFEYTIDKKNGRVTKINDKKILYFSL